MKIKNKTQREGRCGGGEKNAIKITCFIGKRNEMKKKKKRLNE